MKKNEIYGYANPEFAPLRDYMRGVMSAYGDAEKFFATIKEVTWYEYGLKSLTDHIHALEHIQPEEIDAFKNMMAEYGLPLEYPATEELDTAQIGDLDDVFEICVDIVNNIDEKLRAFIAYTDKEQPKLSALARKVENLQMKNAATRTFLLEAWSMWSSEPSYTSFDNWIDRHAPYKHGED